ncbi:MAG: phosphonate ABC transporter, permease protein PhnE [Lachnospiraceae bacterium]|nr:phosphonate ABC transporter, permease protein PhnE [Lachnospiraceae bacterium]
MKDKILYKKHRTLRRLAGVLVFLLLFFAAAAWTDCSLPQLWARRAHLTDIVSGLFPPDWGYFSHIWKPLLATIQMSVTGTGLGAALALLLAPVCARNLRGSRPLGAICRALIQILRSFPALILALLATFLLGLGTFAGTTALTLYTFAILTRLTYEDIENTSTDAYDALCSLGTSPAAAFSRGILPGIAPSYLSNVLYLLETNVRNSSILGYVGAGGIGLLLDEKMSWLEYGKVGTILLALFVTVCVIEQLSLYLGSLIRGERRVSPAVSRGLALTAVAVFIFCTLTLAPPDFSHTSATLLRNMLSGLTHPDWSFFFQADSGGLGYLLLETVAISLVGTCVGALIALPLAFLSSPRFLPRPAAALFRLFTLLIRSVPFMIYGLIFIRVSGPGAFTGVLTLSVCSVGLLTKRFSEAIDALDFRPFQALRALGVAPLPALCRAVLPQCLPGFASAVLYRFDVNIREASVLGLVGAGGIGAPLIYAMNQYKWSTAGAICLGLILLVWLVDLLSARLRRSLD